MDAAKMNGALCPALKISVKPGERLGPLGRTYGPLGSLYMLQEIMCLMESE